MSYYDFEGKFIGLDTVQNTIITNSKFSYEFILGLLNSKFISWFTYKFIYCSAIRTMHFDNGYIGKIIIPNISLKEQKPIVDIVNLILDKTRKNNFHENMILKTEVVNLQKNVDDCVYDLFGISDDEISIIENI